MINRLITLTILCHPISVLAHPGHGGTDVDASWFQYVPWLASAATLVLAHRTWRRWREPKFRR